MGLPGLKVATAGSPAAAYSVLRAAIRDAKGKSEPIHILLQSDSFLSTVDIDYHDGERYPSLVRVEGTPAYLDDITKPLTTPQAVPAAPAKTE